MSYGFSVVALFVFKFYFLKEYLYGDVKMEDIAMVVIKLKRDTGPCLTTLNI